jgi:hypothetical protein
MIEQEQELCEVLLSQAQEPAEAMTDDPVLDDAASEPSTTDDTSEEVERLNARVRELEHELEQRKTLADRMMRECEQFEMYFPEVSLRALPDEVWTQVHAGVPLAAAYALYERGVCNRERQAQTLAARRETQSAGLPGAAQSNYFSPSQVRAMSRQEVRDNYDRIFESMRHWQ